MNLEDLGQVSLTEDGSASLRHRSHGECYHSHSGARLETKLLHLEASGFIRKLANRGQPLSALDVGLGLGYNAILAISAWNENEAPCDVIITSLEIDRDLVEAFASGAAPWQIDWPESEKAFARTLTKGTCGNWYCQFQHESGATLIWQIYIADALTLDLREISSDRRWHIIWQDPFSPKNNPTLWSGAWFKTLFDSAEDGAMLVTYSVARTVRDALSEAGWEWEKLAATGGKRSWLRAIKRLRANKSETVLDQAPQTQP